jgi:hypothetical protein
MTKTLTIIGIILAVIVAGYFGLRAYTKSASPEATATYQKDDLKIEVDYCRPAKKGRVVFGELEPYGKIWRTGANEATEIELSKPVLFGGKTLQAGTYTLFTIPQKDTWTVILNSALDQWGAFSYEEGKDVLRVQVQADSTTDVTEMFTIDFVEVNNSTVHMRLMWDHTKVAVPIQTTSTTGS